MYVCMCALCCKIRFAIASKTDKSHEIFFRRLPGSFGRILKKLSEKIFCLKFALNEIRTLSLPYIKTLKKMNSKNLCPASLFMICMILLSCFAFMFSKTQPQYIAATFSCGISFVFFCLIQWCNNAANKY